MEFVNQICGLYTLVEIYLYVYQSIKTTCSYQIAKIFNVTAWTQCRCYYGLNVQIMLQRPCNSYSYKALGKIQQSFQYTADFRQDDDHNDNIICQLNVTDKFYQYFFLYNNYYKSLAQIESHISHNFFLIIKMYVLLSFICIYME